MCSLVTVTASLICSPEGVFVGRVSLVRPIGSVGSSGGASALPHAALPHASAALPAAGVAAAAAFLDIASQALCAGALSATSQFPLQPPGASSGCRRQDVGSV